MIQDTSPEALLPWETLKPILEGTSGIDVPNLHTPTLEEAVAFLNCYGFDWSRPAHRDQLEALRIEALDFIEDELIWDEPHMAVAPEVREQRDIPQLLCWASRPAGSDPLQIWSCSVLRVMHTFAHCGSFFKRRFDREIQAQILDRFEPHIQREEGAIFLGHGAEAIPLAEFNVKGSKSRRSLAMKLLHKADNVAADIFDWLGVRFITEHRYDALRVARYLREHSVIMFAHVKPGRSRNTLIDIERLRSDLRRLQEGKTLGELRGVSLDTLRALVRSYPYPRPPAAGHNVFTSIAYHSLQFTVSQQIVVRAPRPLQERLATLRASAPECADELEAIIGELQMFEEARFLFPYEVQILDRESYELTQAGLANHDVYKARQRHAVKRRLWGNRIPPSPRPVSNARRSA